MATQPGEVSKAIGFWQHSRRILRRAFENLSWGRDMAIGGCLSVASLVLQVWFDLIPLSDWKAHKWQWIASVVLPSIVVVVINIAWRLITAPWKVYRDQQLAYISEMEATKSELADKQAQIDNLMPHPRLVFERWDAIPEDHPVARPVIEGIDPAGETIYGTLQRGFHMLNDGEPAYEVRVEKFSVGTFEVSSAEVPRIAKDGGFVLVWVAQPQFLQSAQSPGMWDLKAAMAIADEDAHHGFSVAPDFKVRVCVTYRGDNLNCWYRSTAVLTYIRSQRRLEFGAMSHEHGFSTRPS